MSIEVKLDEAMSSEVVALLEDHLVSMQEQTPPESVHALDLSAYESPDLYLWTAWTGPQLMGCGALKDHGVVDGEHLGEIKSMRTKSEFLRRGVADSVLAAIVRYAKEIGMQRLSLETGNTDQFAAANRFYVRRGFNEAEPFAHYTLDPHSVFYTIELKT